MYDNEMKYVVGLGNPDEEYEGTRHNVGRDVVDAFAKKIESDGFDYDKKSDAFYAEGKCVKEKVVLIKPETYMNLSGKSVKKWVTSKKKAKELVVVYDELDMPLGKLKISFGKSSGGHKGVESIIKSIGTKEFIRLRVGISPKTPTGKIKKIADDEKVVKHVLSKFTPKEIDLYKKVKKKAVEAIEIIVTKDYLTASNVINGWSGK